MWERVRGQWIEGKIQNLLMVLRYNKDNLTTEINGVKYLIILDCCLWFVKRWKINKIGMKGVIDIEFDNGKTLTIKYFPKKRPFVNTPEDPHLMTTFSHIMDNIIGYE